MDEYDFSGYGCFAHYWKKEEDNAEGLKFIYMVKPYLLITKKVLCLKRLILENMKGFNLT